MREKVLFVGDNPMSGTGNGNMLYGMLTQVDNEKYDVSCLVNKIGVADPFFDREIKMETISNPYSKEGLGIFLQTIQSFEVDYLVMVGLDIWRYSPVLNNIMAIKNNKPFCWVSIFPWDLYKIRKDWIDWINCVDVPCVYSRFGYDELKPYVPKLKYFKPSLRSSALYKPYSLDKKKTTRARYFGADFSSKFVIGCIAKNQIRKCIPNLMEAYFLAKKDNDDISLYIHSEFEDGVYNLKQMAVDLGAKTGDIITKKQGAVYSEEEMVDVYNSLDCLVNCSAQEGLSWTVLQAMLCGIPVIGSETTSQTELIEGVGELVKTKEKIYIPVPTIGGTSHVTSYTSRSDDIKDAIIKVSSDKKLQNKMTKNGIERGRNWVSTVSDINSILVKSVQKKIKKKNRLLFAQHSAAGDVLMTTRCFKGLKDRYKLPIDYMTLPQYAGVLEGNPYIDNVLPYNEDIKKDYKFVLDIHKDKILQGSWGRNSNSILSDFYWKILNLVPDDFYIAETPVSGWRKASKKPICIVQTSGGDKEFRTYKFMSDVCREIKEEYLTIQLGSKNDINAFASVDLRGKTTYAETAYIMRRAEVAVTIDSYLAHLAGAIGLNQVCLFGCGNYRVVRPNQTKGILISRIPNYVKMACLGPCSGSVKDCDLKCTGSHDPYEIVRDIKDAARGPRPIMIERISK